jgi:hypothetical protein
MVHKVNCVKITKTRDVVEYERGLSYQRHSSLKYFSTLIWKMYVFKLQVQSESCQNTSLNIDISSWRPSWCFCPTTRSEWPSWCLHLTTRSERCSGTQRPHGPGFRNAAIVYTTGYTTVNGPQLSHTLACTETSSLTFPMPNMRWTMLVITAQLVLPCLRWIISM